MTAEPTTLLPLVNRRISENDIMHEVDCMMSISVYFHFNSPYNTIDYKHITIHTCNWRLVEHRSSSVACWYISKGPNTCLHRKHSSSQDLCRKLASQAIKVVWFHMLEAKVPPLLSSEYMQSTSVFIIVEVP